MSGQDLRHLAVITGSAPDHPEELGDAVLASCGKAGEMARAAFSLVPGLLAFSWVDPGLESLLSRTGAPVASRACAVGVRALSAVAADLGVSLRLCGQANDLHGAVTAQPAPGAAGRTLLWFLRYSGRDEIVRAAGRFFDAHPGKTLADGELDAWLDTAGVPDPDLMLYAGGPLEVRDALLWQGSYAEIWHTPEPWRSLSADDLRRAIADYSERQRRFGR